MFAGESLISLEEELTGRVKRNGTFRFGFASFEGMNQGCQCEGSSQRDHHEVGGEDA